MRSAKRGAPPRPRGAEHRVSTWGDSATLRVSWARRTRNSGVGFQREAVTRGRAKRLPNQSRVRRAHHRARGRRARCQETSGTCWGCARRPRRWPTAKVRAEGGTGQARRRTHGGMGPAVPGEDASMPRPTQPATAATWAWRSGAAFGGLGHPTTSEAANRRASRITPPSRPWERGRKYIGTGTAACGADEGPHNPRGRRTAAQPAWSKRWKRTAGSKRRCAKAPSWAAGTGKAAVFPAAPAHFGFGGRVGTGRCCPGPRGWGRGFEFDRAGHAWGCFAPGA